MGSLVCSAFGDLLFFLDKKSKQKNQGVANCYARHANPPHRKELAFPHLATGGKSTDVRGC